jgi:hypothetical protein
MSSAMRIVNLPIAAALAVLLVGCEEQPAGSTTTAASTEPTAAETTTAPPTSASAEAADPNEPKPSYPCPEGSTGDGTSKHPCMAKGASRLMEVTWTGKITDAGPQFRVVNKATHPVLYGNISVYFYDKDGKQLEVPDAEGGKPRPKQTCAGNIFAGPVKVGEKVVLWFSCVRKAHVPEGTVAVEGEMQSLGFTDAAATKSDTFWRNNDLVPNQRPKGGIK